VIHSVEIVRSFDQSNFFRSEGRETVTELLAHGGGVVTVVDGVGEPGDAEFEFAFCGFDI